MATYPNRLPRSAADALWPPAPSWSAKRSWLPAFLQRRTLTVSEDDSVIRVVAFEGRRIVDWATLDIYKEGALSLPATMRKFGGRYVRKVTDLPFYAPLTRTMEKPDVPKRYLEAVIREETKGAIPFEPYEVDIAWTERQRGDEASVMVTATPKREMDAQIDLMHLLRVRPSSMYSRATALALAAGIPNTVIAHLGSGRADLIVVRGDQPKGVHRVVLPSSDQPDEYAAVLTQAIDELTGFEVETAEEGGLEEIAPVVLTGQSPGKPRLEQALRQSLGRRLRAVSPRIEYPAAFPAAEFAANIGLAIADWDDHAPRWRKTRFATAPLTDLLPERHRTRLVPKKALRLTLVGTTLAAVISTTIMGAGDSRLSVEALEAEVTALERQARLNAVEASRFNRRQTEIDAVTAQQDALRAIEEANQRKVAAAIDRLSLTTIDSAVRSVSPFSVRQGRGDVDISATATSINQGLAYAEALRETGLFTTVIITSISSEGGRGSDSNNRASNVTLTLEATYPYAGTGEEDDD